jgi:hypothetical protein
MYKFKNIISIFNFSESSSRSNQLNLSGNQTQQGIRENDLENRTSNNSTQSQSRSGISRQHLTIVENEGQRESSYKACRSRGGTRNPRDYIG